MNMSYKPELVFCGPVTTVSGYGSHARDLVLSLIKMDKFKIKIIPINWGHTPMNALDENNPEHKQILDLINPAPLDNQPDIWMQCTIPNEFNPVGKFNIGITAGIETDICSGEFIEGCNRMNMIIVPSNHAKHVFEKTQYEKRDKQTNQIIGKVELNVPVHVLHEGVRTDIFKNESEESPLINDELNKITENFAFLFVGHWMKGDFGQDRKDVSGLIHTFFETFADRPNPPALVLKTSSGTFSVTDRSRILEKVNLIRHMSKKKHLPNVYVLHGDLTEEEMNTLYNHQKIKAFVSFTKGEGYGRPIAEFMTTGKPVLVSGWSGQLDFIDEKFNTLLKGELQTVDKSAVWEGIINAGSRWFNVDYYNAAKMMDKLYTNYKSTLMSSKKNIDIMKKKWSFDAMHDKFVTMLDSHLPKFAERMKINLPQLKELPKLTQLKKEETP
jgi:glycosyltransferase involved in cell wall biosynthesis